MHARHWLTGAAVATLLTTACARSDPAPESTLESTPVPPGPPPAPSLQQTPDALLAGKSLAVAYSGFRRGQHPDRGDGASNPTRAQILEDLRILTRDGNFGLIRLYDSGGNSAMVLELIESEGLDLRVMLGAWLSAELSNHEGCAWLDEPIPPAELEANVAKNREEVGRAIALARRYPDIVVAVNVGNEALVTWNDHMVSMESMKAYVARVKRAIDQPVTTAENYVIWAEKGAELAEVVDFAAVHTYPVWEGRDIDEGMSYTLENLQAVRNANPELRMAIAEAGWASTANEFGDRADQSKQKRYFDELSAWCAAKNVTLFFFEAFDESWKGDPSNPAGAEKHWGLFTEDRCPKLVMRELYPDLEPAAAVE